MVRIFTKKHYRFFAVDDKFCPNENILCVYIDKISYYLLRKTALNVKHCIDLRYTAGSRKYSTLMLIQYMFLTKECLFKIDIFYRERIFYIYFTIDNDLT